MRPSANTTRSQASPAGLGAPISAAASGAAGFALSGARPVYLEAQRNPGLDGLFGIDPEAVEEALHRNRQIRAVHIGHHSINILANSIFVARFNKGRPIYFRTLVVCATFLLLFIFNQYPYMFTDSVFSSLDEQLIH